MPYLPPMSRAALQALPKPAGPFFAQGERVQDASLDILFLTQEGDDISPFGVSYAVGTADPQNLMPIGSSRRRPLNPRTGLFRPNFQVGDDWFTGAYECRWEIRVSEGSTPVYRTATFNVYTAGTLDVPAQSMGVFDMSASIFVI